MKKIFFKLLLSLPLFGSEHIPFGIKDLCSPIIKDKSFVSCYDKEDRLKWISYTPSNRFETDTPINTLDKDVFEATGLNPFFLNPNNKDEFFLTNKNNINLILEAIKQSDAIIENIKKPNIIKGLVYSQKNDIYFEFKNRSYYYPSFLYIIITDIDSKQIKNITLIDLEKFETLKNKSLEDIEHLTDTKFLFKLKTIQQ